VKKTSYRLSALIASGLLIAACGSSSSSRSVPAASAGGTTSAPTATGGGSTSASSTAVGAKKNKLGTILAAGPKKLTVYVFEADKGTTSNCSAACAKVWPPVTGTATATPPAQQSLIGTTTRSDGTKQVTYKGHPLYFFAKDKDDGDAYGQGVKHFGGSWYAVKPNGSKLDQS
jgi:predicted lipoprotein with Yx(FWY)xxD motif